MVENESSVLNLMGDLSVNKLDEKFNLLKSSLDTVVGNCKDTTA